MKNLIFIFTNVITAMCFGLSFISAQHIHTIHSEFTDKTYQVKVSLPKSYSDQDKTTYPVFYALDGNASYNTLTSIRDIFEKDLKDIIIVSIDLDNGSEEDWYASRNNDYTISHLPQADTLWAKILKISISKMQSGGADNFINSLENEIIPFVENKYKTAQDRGLFGHSLGGLFASYCLLKRPDMFQKYSINSPSLWWNNREILNLEKVLFEKNEAIAANVFISIGGLEGDMMLDPFKDFSQSLKSRYTNIKLTNYIFEGETHISVIPACISRSLRMLYGNHVN